MMIQALWGDTKAPGLWRVWYSLDNRPHHKFHPTYQQGLPACLPHHTRSLQRQLLTLLAPGAPPGGQPEHGRWQPGSPAAQLAQPGPVTANVIYNNNIACHPVERGATSRQDLDAAQQQGSGSLHLWQGNPQPIAGAAAQRGSQSFAASVEIALAPHSYLPQRAPATTRLLPRLDSCQWSAANCSPAAAHWAPGRMLRRKV